MAGKALDEWGVGGGTERCRGVLGDLVPPEQVLIWKISGRVEQTPVGN